MEVSFKQVKSCYTLVYLYSLDFLQALELNFFAQKSSKISIIFQQQSYFTFIIVPNPLDTDLPIPK